MILKNKKGMERNFRVLFKLNKNKFEYIVYEDINTLNIYGGKLVDNNLIPLDEKEYKFIYEMVEKISE